MYFVYVLIDMKGNSYIGLSCDIEKRLLEHNTNRSSYTKGSKWKLVYYEAYLSKGDAVAREKRLKHDGRSRYALMSRIQNSKTEALVG